MQTPTVTVWAMGWAIGKGGYLVEGTKLAGGERCCRESALQRRGALFFRCGSVGWTATRRTRTTYGDEQSSWRGHG
jgi:hypothetical protein